MMFIPDPDLISAEARAFWDDAEARFWDVWHDLYPPVQCAPAVGVHQGCEHAVQSRPTAHFTIDQGGTCTRNSRVSGRCDVDCWTGEQSPAWAELVPSTVAPPVDASNPYAGQPLAELEAVMQSEEYLRPAPATGSHGSSGCNCPAGYNR